MTTIELTDKDAEQIEEFIDAMLDAGKTTKCDDFREAYNRGKGAEIAVSRFLENEYDLATEVDFDVYEGADTTDLKPYNVEVKVIPHYGNWCAIPESQFARIADEPIIIVKHNSDEDYFEVAGWTLPEELFVIEQGERVFTQYGDNYCKRVNHCSDDWKALVSHLQQQQDSTGGGGFTFAQ